MQAVRAAALAIACGLLVAGKLAAQDAPPPIITIAPAEPMSAEERARYDERRAQADAESERIFREQGMFGLVLAGEDAPRRIQFCGFIAEGVVANAPQTADPALRASRVGDAWRLQQRLAPLLTAANAGLSDRQLTQIARVNGEMIGLLSYVPEPWLAEQMENGADWEADFDYLFPASIARRCDAMLDEMGVAQIVETPSAEVLAPAWNFRWQGKTGAELFAETELLPWAGRICVERATPVTAADFADAPLDQRGFEGISLLDWAMECDDREAYAALLDAGFDPTTPGAFDDMPLLSAAKQNATWFLQQLLDRGFPADSFSDQGTALSASWLSQHNAGEAFAMLRTAGASLNYPDYGRSMWNTWSVFNGWQEIVDHWDEFDSDPVHLGLAVTIELNLRAETEGSGRRANLQEIKRRLTSEYGVCFPVGFLPDLVRDERGFYIQPDCPREETP